MSRIIHIESSSVSEFLTPEEISNGYKVRLYVTKSIRSPKGTKGVRKFEGSPIDDSPAGKSDLKLKVGDSVSYNGEVCTVTKARKVWIELDSKIWTRIGNLEAVAAETVAA